MNRPASANGWQETNITPLEHPIGEFNARGGMDLDEYQRWQQHLADAHPAMGAEQWAEIKEELPPFELLEDPKTGQKLRLQRFNWPEDGDISDQTVTFNTLAFSVPIDQDHVQYQRYLLAKEIGTPLVVFENIGYGESDKLTKEQKADLRRGDFGSVVAPMLGIAEAMDVKLANFMGYSMGAETAAAMAANANDYGIKVKNLFVMEGPGVTPQRPLKLGKEFLSDSTNLKFTWQHPIDPVMREIAKIKPAMPKGTLSYGLGMTKGSLYFNILTAISKQPDMRLTIASAGSSKVSPKRSVNNLVAMIRGWHPNQLVRHIIIPGESHSYGDSGQRFAQLGKMVLKH